MSGGVAYVFDSAGSFPRRCNREMVDLEAVDALEDIELLQRLIRQHVEYTGSELGARILVEWDATLPSFVKVMPRDYRRVLQAQAKAAAAGREATFTELVGVAAG
jgi:glutamate synthase (ferredoxin)